MVYVIRLTSWKKINFMMHVQDLINAETVYNTRSKKSKKNVKEIRSLSILNSNEIEIELFSTKKLATGREANALWLFSHELVENQGFDIYLNNYRKLLKTV